MGLGGSKIGQNRAQNGKKSLKIEFLESDSTIEGRKFFYKSRASKLTTQWSYLKGFEGKRSQKRGPKLSKK